MTLSDNALLKINAVGKHYDDFVALDGVSLSIP